MMLSFKREIPLSQKIEPFMKTLFNFFDNFLKTKNTPPQKSIKTLMVHENRNLSSQENFPNLV